MAPLEGWQSEGSDWLGRVYRSLRLISARDKIEVVVPASSSPVPFQRRSLHPDEI